MHQRLENGLCIREDIQSTFSLHAEPYRNTWKRQQDNKLQNNMLKSQDILRDIHVAENNFIVTEMSFIFTQQYNA